MAIFRGDGGAGDSNTDSMLSLVTAQAVIATTKASEAASSETNASNSETVATTKASEASTSATEAANSATGVAQYATAAANSATAAANSATNASTSATAAASSASSVSSDAAAAATSATNSASSATASASSATIATTKASEASTSASGASTSATNAATSATNASSSESTSATNATNAANSATAAASSASGASTSATNANNSAIAAAASAASIGTDPSFNSVTVTGTTAVKMSAGTTAQRPTGVAGQFRYNTTEGKFEGYSTEWGEIGGGAADLRLNSFTGNGSTTAYTLSTSPVEDNTLVYIDGVYQNKTGYAIVDNVLTFSSAPPNSSAIEITAATIAPVTASTEFKLSQFTGNGSTTVFTLSAQSPENNTNVYIDGVYQSKSNYAVSGTTLTFSTAPPSGSAIEVMAANAVVVSVGTPDDGTVTTAKIANNAVTTAKIADANVTTAKIASGAVTAAKIDSVPIAVGITSVVTATSLTATVNTHVYVSAATQTITLPASPAIGQRVLITVGNFADTVVARNGSNIMSSATDFTMDAAYLSIQFIYTDATQGWVMS